MEKPHYEPKVLVSIINDFDSNQFIEKRIACRKSFCSLLCMAPGAHLDKRPRLSDGNGMKICFHRTLEASAVTVCPEGKRSGGHLRGYVVIIIFLSIWPVSQPWERGDGSAMALLKPTALLTHSLPAYAGKEYTE